MMNSCWECKREIKNMVVWKLSDNFYLCDDCWQKESKNDIL